MPHKQQTIKLDYFHLVVGIGSASGFLAQLKPGKLVVHLRYGVGRYLGLQQLAVAGSSGEYLLIEYANNDLLYLPVSDFDLITIYCGPEAEYPLDQLGNNRKWLKRKHKLKEQLEDTAAKLLSIYAKRKVIKAPAWEFDAKLYEDFASHFPFALTCDQQKAIDEVITDLTSGYLMDRLICGDVGFGKTEVALRAIFIALTNGFQVAVLVPTTILGQQHLVNFKQRLDAYGARIAFLHAGQSAAEQRSIKEQLADGKIDILIATHALLQTKACIRFAKLKLLVVDEEHRFGVQQKEYVAQLSKDVSILSLSATPIPRTMQLALTNLRQMSIISTPPMRRKAIKTVVAPYSLSLVQEAIERELTRQGLLFYLHNHVSTLAYTAKRLGDMFPRAHIAIAHGQMDNRETEQIMEKFRAGEVNILVCTTVIESGLDVPDANTIIIERADLLGLAQLHQLRGRVGRASVQGFAYLLLPADEESYTSNVTESAKQRLQAILAMQDLGSGFNLAMRDLEIRGVGEFLGTKQSGMLDGVGFALYQSMMERAIELAQQGKKITVEDLDTRENVIDIALPAFIPEKYLDDPSIRLMLYKQIASCQKFSDLEALQAKLQTELGTFAQPMLNLFELKRLNLRAAALKISSITFDRDGLQIKMNDPGRWEWYTLCRYWRTQQIGMRFTKDGGIVVAVSCAGEKLLEHLAAWFNDLEEDAEMNRPA